MPEGTKDQQPVVFMLYFEPTLKYLIAELFNDVGYAVTTTPRAADVFTTLETSSSACLVLMDNFHVSKEAHLLLAALRARPELRRRAKVIGLAALANWPPKGSEMAGEIDEYVRCRSISMTSSA